MNVLFSEEEIRARVSDLAQKICKEYKGKDLLMVGVLRGSFMFFSDLVREMDKNISIDFLKAYSYVKDVRNKGTIVNLTFLEDLTGKNVLLIEDIIDKGWTLRHVVDEILNTYKPKSLKICVLLDKSSAREVNVPVDFCGFTVPDPSCFVVGYGLDYGGKYRGLPYIGYLDEEEK